MPTRTAISRSYEWLLTVGVFLIFGQIGIFIALLQDEPPGWLLTLSLWAASGLIALGWSFSINRGGRWLLLIVPLLVLPWTVIPFVLGYLFDRGWMSPGYEWAPLARSVFATAFGIVSLSIGFTCVIMCVSRTERAAALARAELDVAARMHQTIVPDIDHRGGGVEVWARSTPSSEMGGDLVDLVQRDGRVDALLADVSGHGVGAGVVMAMLKAAARTRLHSDSGLAPLVGDLNRVVHELTESNMFVTGAWVRVEPGRVWRVALAGHLPALYYRAAAGKVERIDHGGLPLGVVANERYDAAQIHAAPGDTLLLVTDGFVEVFDKSGAQLGLSAIERAFGEHASEPLASIDLAVRSLASAHGASKDDRSLLLVRATEADA